jgi:hypothetical protein
MGEVTVGLYSNGCSLWGGHVCEWTSARYNGGMRFRVGLVAGFAIGYYLGSKAGRERYEQIQRWLEDARQSRPVEKAQAAVELGLERIRQQTEAVTGTSPNGPGASS